MIRSRRTRIILLALTLPQFLLPPAASLAGIFDGRKGHGDGPITLQQAAAWVDQIDRRLFELGTIGVKTPDVWGQNRMTVYRAEYETQMQSRLNQFQVYLQAAQDRTDLSALTSATSLGATVAATQSKKSGPFAAIAPKSFNVNVGTPNTATAAFPSGNLTYAGGASPIIALAPPPPVAASPASPTPAAPGNPDFTGMAAQLDAISKRIDELKQGTLTLPTGINNFVTGSSKTGVGIEPTIALDQEGNYINHLNQLRRINAGDDLTDLAGYGLYLLRMPVSLMPGPESRKGKGAIVTVEARHDLTEDLLPNTFRDVAILDLTYALTQVVNEKIHKNIYEKCHSSPTIPAAPKTSSTPPAPLPMPTNPSSQPPNSPPTSLYNFDGPFPNSTRTPNNVAGPFPTLLHDLQLILSSIEEPVGGVWSDYLKDHPEITTKWQDREIAEKAYLVKYSDRLHMLIASMTNMQSDPYRHDPSTLSMFQSAILDAWRYMRDNAAQGCTLFQTERIELFAQLLLRRDYQELRKQREQFLWELYCYRAGPSSAVPITDRSWASQVEPSDILAFALLIQFINVDRQLKWDMKYMSQRRGCNCGEVDHLFFYDFEPSPDARAAFRDYVACKWPLHIYSVDPVLDQQNVLDAYSRRTELQLALAVSVATGQFNVKNATSFARQLDLDLQTVGLNRTSVGFGAGETTFGWMFYPRVQTPQPVSNFRTLTNTMTGTGQGINADLRSRRIEPGQRECVALMVTPNFIPAIKVSTVTNWFDVTGHHAKPKLSNQEMIELGRMLQQAKCAVARACDSGEYRATDFVVLNQRIKQLEALLPTQDTRVALPDEGDLLGSEIFSPDASGLSPSLLAWYGEPIQEGTAGSIFLQGRGFSVSETQVVVGGMPLMKGRDFRLISRNVMQIIVPANARSTKVEFELEHEAQKPATPKAAVATLAQAQRPTVEARGGKAEVRVNNDVARAELDPKLTSDVNVTVDNGAGSTANVRGAKVDVHIGDVHAQAEGAPALPKTDRLPCDRAVIDVHIATPNGISNHLYVEVVPKPKAPTPKNAVTTATTTTTVHGNTTTTTTKFETTPPGTVLPPLTVLPMGTPWPMNTMLAPGPVAPAPMGSLLPGMVPSATPPPSQPLTLTPQTPAASTATPAASMTPTSPATTAPAPSTAPNPPPAPPRPSAPSASPATPGASGASPSATAEPPPGGGFDGQVGVAAPNSSPTALQLPPLPDEAPSPAPSTVDGPASRRVRPPLLRRIGLPDR